MPLLVRPLARLVLVAALVPLAPPLGARPQEVDLAGARRDVVDRLEEHAGWCQANKLYLQRQHVYAKILAVDEDHGEARRALGFKRSRGEWVPPARPREIEDRDTEALAEAGIRLREAVAPYCDTVADLVEAGALEPRRLEELGTEALGLDPDHARLRALRGDVRHEGRWVLRETRDAARTRVELARMVQQCLRGAPVLEPAEPTARQADMPLPFVGRASESLLVLGTGDAGEAEELGRAVLAAQELYHRVLGARPPLPADLTLYVLDGLEQRDAFLEGLSALSEDECAAYRRLDGAGVTNADWAWWTGNRAKRLDALVRMAIGYFFLVGHDIGIDQGWVREGLGLYLGKALVGTRLTWFLTPGEEGDPGAAMAARNVLLDPATNWLEEAHERLTAKDPARLESIFGKPAGSLGVDDVVLSYALCAYLVEARTEELRTLLRELGGGADAARTAEALERVLGMGPEELGLRLARWMEESHAQEFAPPVVEGNLLAGWDELEAGTKARVAERFGELVEELDSPLLRRVRGLRERVAAELGTWPERTRPEHYDPNEHAPGDPIGRRWLDEDHRLVRKAHEELLPPRDPKALVPAYAYEWGARRVVVVGDPRDPESIVANAANGYPPDASLALAVLLRDLDGAHHVAEQRAFDHAYTDRDGGVYPGLTLFDAWASRRTIEMPDVDALGIVHDVWNDWKTWVAPIPGSEHDRLYGRIQVLFERVRGYRSLREELALLCVVAEPPAGRYVPTRTNLHALWATADDDPERLAALLPDGDALDQWLSDWVEHCKREGDDYELGKRREAQLAKDCEAVRRALARALEEVGAR